MQSSILDHFGLKDLYSTVSVNLISKSIGLRVELAGQNIQENDILFENDIINIKIENNVIFFTCIIYSNYGVDRIVNYHDKIDDFNMNIFDELFPSLSICVYEHVNYYI